MCVHSDVYSGALRMPKMVRSPPSTAPTSPVRDKEQAKPSKGSLTRRDKRRRLSVDDDTDARATGGEDNAITALANEMRDLFESLKSDQNSRLDALDKRITNFENRFDMKISAVQDSNKNVEKAVELFADQLAAIQNKMGSLESDRKELSTRIASLDEKCDILEHSLRKPCIEIRNVPKRPKERKEDLYNSLFGLIKSLNTSLELADVRDVYRIPVRTSKDCSTIIVELCNTLAKGKILHAAKRHNSVNRDNQINSSHLGIDGLRTTIYLSEYLSYKNKKLHYLARELAKSEHYAYCWTSSGRVYLRKRDGDPYILVRSEEQLKELATKE